MPSYIIFNAINVNSQSTNTAVFVGETAAPGWDSHNKNQSSIASMTSAFVGGNFISNNLNWLVDNDVLDTLILDGFEKEGGPSAQA
jgi:hypothetical protein